MRYVQTDKILAGYHALRWAVTVSTSLTPIHEYPAVDARFPKKSSSVPTRLVATEYSIAVWDGRLLLHDAVYWRNDDGLIVPASVIIHDTGGVP